MPDPVRPRGVNPSQDFLDELNGSTPAPAVATAPTRERGLNPSQDFLDELNGMAPAPNYQPVGEDLAGSFNADTARLAQMLGAGPALIEAGIRRFVGPTPSATDPTFLGMYMKAQQQQNAIAERAATFDRRPGAAGYLQRGVSGAVGSIQSTLPTLAAGGMTAVSRLATPAAQSLQRLGTASVGAGLASTVGEVQQDPRVEAVPYAVVNGVIEGVMSRLGGTTGVEALLRTPTGSQTIAAAIKDFGGETIKEMPPEGLTAIFQGIVGQAKSGQFDSSQLTDQGIEGMIAGGVTSAAVNAPRAAMSVTQSDPTAPPLPPPGAGIPPSTSPSDNINLTPEELAAFEQLQNETPTTDPTQTIRADDGRQGFTPEELDALKYKPTPPTSPTGPDSQGEPVVDEMLKLDPEVIGALGRLDRNAGDTVDAPIRNDINPEAITGDSTAVDIKRRIPARQEPDETRIGAPITITPKERGPSQTDTQILPTLPDVKGMRIEQAERRVKELENRLKSFTAEAQKQETTPLMRAYAKKAQDEDQAALEDMRAELAFYNEADDSAQPEEDVIDRLRAEGGIMGPDKRSAGEYDAYKALPPEVKRMVSGRKKKTEAANDGTGLARVGPVRAPGTAIDVIAKAMKDSHGYGDGTPETLVNLIQQAADNRAAKRKQAADAKIAKKNPSDEEAYRAGVPTRKKDLPPDPKEATQTIDNEVVASLQRQLDEAKAKLGEVSRAPDPLAPAEKPKQPEAVKPSVKPQDKANEYINSLNLQPDEKKVAQDALGGWNSELDPNGYKGNIDSVLLFTREKAAKKKQSAVAQVVQTLAAKDGKPAMHKSKVSPLTGGDPGVVAVIDPLIGTMQIREDATDADVQRSAEAMKSATKPDLSGKQVNVEVDGSTAKVDAREAVVMLRKRLSALRSILSCLE